MSEKAKCRSCRAPMVWVQTEAGKRTPIDPEPVAGGNIIIKDRTQDPPVVAYVKPDQKIKRFVSHFSTCPQSKSWRKK